MAASVQLNSGGDEMKLLIFRLGDTLFGVNVSRVREIIEQRETIKIPHTPPSVDGIFKLRDEVLTLVKLGQHFGMECDDSKDNERAIIIVEFNQARYGILVDAVDVIQTLRWEEIEPPSKYLSSLNAPITGTARVNEKTILIADFEAITEEILGIAGANPITDVASGDKTTKNVRLLLADDSSTLRKSIAKILRQYGYNDLTICDNGLLAWERIHDSIDSEKGPIDLVISDIEMPQMDGLQLTTKIKQDAKLQNVKVVLFSSLINKESLAAGKTASADALVSKPDSEEMIHAIQTCLSTKEAETEELATC